MLRRAGLRSAVPDDIEATLKRYQRLVRKASDDDEIAAILRKVYNEVWEPVEQAFPARHEQGHSQP